MTHQADKRHVIDYYEILGVSPDAAEKEIRLAYRRLVFESHPDRHGSNPNADVLLQQINEAYHVLSNSDLRHDYDHALFGASLRPSAESYGNSDPRSHHRKAPLLAETISKTFSLGWTLSGCLIALALQDTFLPLFSLTSAVVGVILLSLIGGGFSAALAERFELPRVDGSFVGVFLGALLGAAWLSPETDSYSFFIALKLCFGSGLAGSVGGAIAGWAFKRPPPNWSPRAGLGTGLFVATLLGACFGGVVGLSLSYQLSNEAFLVLLAMEPPENLEWQMTLLASVAAAAGGLLVGLKCFSEKSKQSTVELEKEIDV